MRSFFAALIVFCACLITAGGHLYAPDDEVMFRMAQSIALHGHLSIEPIEGNFASATGRDGHSQYAQYGVGQALLSAPLIYLGEGLGRALGTRTHALVFNEVTAYYTRGVPTEIMQRFCASFFNAFIVAALAGVLCAFATRLTGNRDAAFATSLMFGLATFALAHARTYFSEPLATLCIFSSLALLHLGLRQGHTGKLVVAGALAGFSALVRTDAVVAWPALALYLAWSLWRPLEEPLATSGAGRRMRYALAFSLPLALGAAMLAGLNFYKFGSPFKTGYGAQPEGINFGTPLLVGLQGLLFSIGRGLIYFSPPLVLALWAFGSLHKIERRLTLVCGLLVAMELCFYGKWINWSGAWCWGPRHIFIVHVFLALPIAAWLAKARINSARRIAFWVLCVAGFGVQLYGCSEDFIQFYDVMFRTPGQEPNSRALYSEAELPWHDPYYILEQRLPGNTLRPIPLTVLGAPVNDSLYVPQNSCWAGYAAMWRAGYRDNLWLRLMGK